MSAQQDWFFPYPANALDRVGYIIGDIVSLAIVLLIASAILRV